MRPAARLLFCLLPCLLAQPALAARSDALVHGAAVNPCLVSEAAGQHGQRLRNLCTFRINITFCQIKRESDDCAAGRIGGTTMAPRSSRSLLDDVLATHYVVCRAPYALPRAAAAWQNGRLVGRCQATRAAAQAARRH
ncbi:hypothetical protein [Bordetella genomosp. 12]|uniref:Lipoprotein n=1 Tax=Bordetella genomosp. 12 TaxID=463035 RepID=A0A261VUM4_9BORD|nr:hypothetical protein [Bordetella genomosp. 12]OZI77739.1 hypothetical protein CAL22_04195 [Bordetella genomosp. 12]